MAWATVGEKGRWSRPKKAAAWGEREMQAAKDSDDDNDSDDDVDDKGSDYGITAGTPRIVALIPINRTPKFSINALIPIDRTS
ncbi:hypothetical protein GW17_00052333 [Ensete ventricosum]|nr:hypothetical protein GW17_00052333 [Ensete ventricosum]RZR93213.1 hypothetical protein BHM03_00021653 [Ensete ventricosum]